MFLSSVWRCMTCVLNQLAHILSHSPCWFLVGNPGQYLISYAFIMRRLPLHPRRVTLISKATACHETTMQPCTPQVFVGLLFDIVWPEPHVFFGLWDLWGCSSKVRTVCVSRRAPSERGPTWSDVVRRGPVMFSPSGFDHGISRIMICDSSRLALWGPYWVPFRYHSRP
jgi:hypothetical protein